MHGENSAVQHLLDTLMNTERIEGQKKGVLDKDKESMKKKTEKGLGEVNGIRNKS